MANKIVAIGVHSAIAIHAPQLSLATSLHTLSVYVRVLTAECVHIVKLYNHVHMYRKNSN